MKGRKPMKDNVNELTKSFLKSVAKVHSLDTRESLYDLHSVAIEILQLMPAAVLEAAKTEYLKEVSARSGDPPAVAKITSDDKRNAK
jgi:hypothetical protein